MAQIWRVLGRSAADFMRLLDRNGSWKPCAGFWAGSGDSSSTWRITDGSSPASHSKITASSQGVRAELRDPAPVMDAAAAFLSVRSRSVTETRRRLHHLGYPDPLVENVIDPSKTSSSTSCKGGPRYTPTKGELSSPQECAQASRLAQATDIA